MYEWSIDGVLEEFLRRCKPLLYTLFASFPLATLSSLHSEDTRNR